MASFEFTDRDYKERKIILEVDHESNVFGVVIRDTRKQNGVYDMEYMSGIVPLDDLRVMGGILGNLKEVN